MYTIEKHLEHLAQSDANTQTIYSVWNLNKVSLKKALSTIQITFPHYSIHDYTHADTIIKNIELFLGKDRIERLGPTDAWLILMSAYTHDIGMVVFMKDLEAQMNDTQFIDELRQKVNDRKDIDLSESASLILAILKKDTAAYNTINENPLEYVLKIKKAVTILSADLFRKLHPKRSKEILQGSAEAFANEFHKFYSQEIPARFFQILGNIAYSHGIDFYESIELLPKKSNGFSSDYMHPRFVSSLLRLGDLLDVDDKRFNQFTTKVFETDRVKSSEIHEEKHASITHLLVTPENIEITADCKENEDVFRIANQWFDWLKLEVENQNKEWNNIRPDNFPGLPPNISRNKVKALFNGQEVDPDLINLRFNISSSKVFEIFEGKALYDDPSFVFLREIAQNAVDATKVQLWKDIERGLFDSIIRNHLTKIYSFSYASFTHEELIAAIRFPSDIPTEIIDSYTALLNIYWKDDKREVLVIKISDKGCGIDKISLLRICNKVGTSRSADSEYQKLKTRMPFFLKATGAFGLGLQSIFLVANEFQVITKSENDDCWKINFRSARNGEYIDARKLPLKHTVGTDLTIEIPKEKFDSVFDYHFSSEELKDYDSFLDRTGSPYIHKLRHFISDHLSNLEFMEYRVLDYNIKTSSFYSRIENPHLVQLSKENDIQILIKEQKIIQQNKIGFKFQVLEFIEEKVGSKILLDFRSAFPLHFHLNFFGSHNNKLFAVRNIEITDDQNSYMHALYSEIKINFLNAESDKLLNIARSKLIQKNKEEFNILFIKIILPRVLLQLYNYIEAKYDHLEDLCRKTKNNIAIFYFHFSLTCLLNKIELDDFANKRSKYFGEFLLPETLVSRYSDDWEAELISPATFFDEKSFIYVSLTEAEVFDIISLPNRWEHTLHLDHQKEALIKITGPKCAFKNKCIVWSGNYLSYYLLACDFNISRFILDSEKKIVIGYEITRIEPGKAQAIDVAKEDLKSILKEYFPESGPSTIDRFLFPPINPFAQALAVKGKEGDEYFIRYPHLCNTGIISPFRFRRELAEIRNDTRSLLSNGENEKLKQIIKDKYLHTLIPDLLIIYVLEHAVFKQDQDADLVRSQYVELIAEILMAFKDDKSLNSDGFILH